MISFAAGAAFLAGLVAAKLSSPRSEAAHAPQVPSAQRQKALEHVEAALSARFTGRHLEALDQFRKAASLDPSLRGLQCETGLTQMHLGDFDAAEASARRSIELGEEKSNAFALLGLIALERSRGSGQPSAAREAVMQNVQASRAADPLNSMPLYVLGEFHRAVGEEEPAVEAYRMALDRVSESDSILVSTVKAGLTGMQLDYKPGSPPYKIQQINGIQRPEELFFAAADALLRGDKAAAAAFLSEAHEKLPEPLFKALLQDPIFQDYAIGVLSDPTGPSNPQP
ncbi:MAG: hypothetical protein FGM15_02690 [Chthoniobacterales bacterium]|nr:hypothetical protein [Chthoniobacterales bacterium]